VHSGGLQRVAVSTRLRRQLQRGTPEYGDTQNVGATTVYEQPNMTLGPGANRLPTSKSCGAPIEAAPTMFRDLTEQLWVDGWWRGWRAWRRALCAANEIRVVNYSRSPSW
jgi:hypothetical protein